MPKVLSERDKRERALRRAVARAKVDLGMNQDKQVGERLGLATSTFYKRRETMYKSFGFEKASALARALKFTGREVCEILGVPYASEEEGKERGI